MSLNGDADSEIDIASTFNTVIRNGLVLVVTDRVATNN